MRSLTENQGVTAAGLADQSDEELLVAYRETEDRQAFAELVHRYERELYSYLRRYLGDAAMAEDTFQTTFLQVHLKCGQFDEHRKVRPWLYTIATNQAIDTQRRNKRHRLVSLNASRRNRYDDEGTLGASLVSAEIGPDSRIEAAEQHDEIRRAVDELPEQYRTVVLLVYFQGLKYREAAESLSIPVGTVKSRIHTAITKLNETWQRTHPG